MTDTVVLKCPKCGHFIAEIGNFVRARCCGYEIIVSLLRTPGLTTPAAKPTLIATTT